MLNALIIDDKLTNVDVLSLLLEQEGVNSSYVLDLDETFDALKSNTFDIIFLDIVFPGRDSLGILSKIKMQYPQIPIVAYSVYASQLDRARRAGFDAFLGKPLQSQEFPAQLRRILNGESIWQI
jgi:two-component system cell cycle response regulator DivK